jgi:hypothetical protein
LIEDPDQFFLRGKVNLDPSPGAQADDPHPRPKGQAQLFFGGPGMNV